MNTNESKLNSSMVTIQSSETRQQLVNDYGGRVLNSLEVNADESGYIVSFKDSPEVTTIFKYPDDQLTIMEIEVSYTK